MPSLTQRMHAQQPREPWPHPGLRRAAGGERAGEPRRRESALECRRRLRPSGQQGRGDAACRGTHRLLRQPAARVQDLRRHTGHCDHVRGLWRACGACGLRAWRGPAFGCKNTHTRLQPRAPRLPHLCTHAATLCARVRSRPRVRPTSCPKRTSSLWATSTARRPPWCRPRRLLWPAPPGRWPRCRPRTWTCLTRHATPRSRQPMATAWARASHRRLEQTCSPMRTRLQPCVRTRPMPHANLRRAPCDGRRSQHVLDVHWCPRRRPHSRPGH